MFKPGDAVRVNDEWWARGARPGTFTNPPNIGQRDFVVQSYHASTHNEVTLVGCNLPYMSCVFEPTGGPW